MICPDCGKKNADDNHFCGNCGARLGTPDALGEPRDDRSTHDDQPGDMKHRSPTLFGLDLPVRQTHYPREGYEPKAETPPISSIHEEFPPEVIEYDKQVPLIAEPGSDRRHNHHFTERRRDEQRDDLNPESTRNESEDSSRHASERVVPPNEYAPTRPLVDTRAPELRREPRSQSSYSSGYTGGILGLNVPTSDEIGATETASTPRVQDVMVSHPAEDRLPPTDVGRDHFLDFGESQRDDNSLHGPSFLGLSSSPEDYEEVEPAGHGRRNFALFVLILLAILIALQWRSIRDFGAQYAQRGGIHIPGMKTSKAENSSATPADASAANSNNTTAVNGTPTNSNEGPSIEVAPTQNPNAKSDAGAQPPASGQAQGQPRNSAGNNPPAQPGGAANTAPQTSNSAADKNAANSDGKNVTSKDATDGKTGGEVASNATHAADSGDSMPQGEPDTETVVDVDQPSAKAARKEPPARQPADDPSRFGAAELAQANAASDPATQANWLWKATAKGNWEAPVRLADMYIAGRGVPQDCDQAMVILRSASAKKNARARSKLGSLYAAGQCVEQDRVAAYHWMSLALQANPGSEWIDHNRQTLWSQMNDDERRRAARDHQ